MRLDHYSELTFGLRVQNHTSTLAYSGDARYAATMSGVEERSIIPKALVPPQP